MPAGLSDGLPPEAGFEAAIVERLMAAFAAWGYERVKPPLIEFEDSLLSGPGEAMAADTFRLMDPVSQRMMGLRADITPQVGRIAASRLTNAPRPIRLSYAGQVLRVKGEQMRPERQIGQAGVELIGTTAAAADAEVILLGAEALNAVGVKELVVDLNVPTLAPALLWEAGIGDARNLIAALDRKDMTAVRQAAGELTPLLEALIHAVGPADTAIEALDALPLQGSAAKQRERLREVVMLIRAARPDLTLTIDPTDHRGFEYHTGVTFSLLAPAVRGDFGRGGRYVNQAGEPATGFTLYLDTLQRALPAPAAPNRVFVPNGTPATQAQKLRGEGWVTIQGLEAVKDDAVEAWRLGCTRLWRDGELAELK
ncbi:ATP phosphoribosyltransferase regulatory subunit [Dongia sp.]|uniref:ATP phosphoribosyltransferase regulatory subunit n=1 Tax=Dongia sp. TaxID=1977262 RepID=UPI0037518F44